MLNFATIVGNIGNVISNTTAGKTEFQKKMDVTQWYMTFGRVGKDQLRVVQWFDYLWNNKQALDEEAVLDDLPEKLKAEIAMNVLLETLKRVAIFQECESGMLMQLMLSLKLS